MMMKKLMIGSLFLMLYCVFPNMGFAIGTPNVSLTWTTPLPANSIVGEAYNSITLNVKNQSTENVPVTFKSINAIATNPQDFTLTDTNHCVGATLAVGSSCNITLTYSPLSSGTKSLAVTAKYNNTSSTSLLTTSQSRNVSIAWTMNLPSGALAVNDGSGTSQTVGVTYTNNNADSITFTPTVTFSNNGTSGDITDFTLLSNTCGTPPTTLSAGASCVVNYTYAPLTAGLKQGFANNTPSRISNAVSYTKTGILSDLFNPFGLAWDGTHVFYTANFSDGQVFEVCILGVTSNCYSAIDSTESNFLTGILSNSTNLYAQISNVASSSGGCNGSGSSCGLVYYTNNSSGILTYVGNAVISGSNNGGGLSNSANGLAFDNNSNVWQLAQSFNSGTRDSVDMLNLSGTPSGTLSTTPIGTLGQSNQPFAIISGPNNMMWFTLESGATNIGYNLGSISAVSPVIVKYTLSDSSSIYYPRALASDGTYLWVTAYDPSGNGWLLQISPNTCVPNSTCPFVSKIEFNAVSNSGWVSRPNAIVYDSNNRVFWITETVYTDSSLGTIASSNIYRIAPSQSSGSQVMTYALPVVAADPRAMVIVPSTTTGSTQVYFTEYGANVIGQFSY